MISGGGPIKNIISTNSKEQFSSQLITIKYSEILKRLSFSLKMKGMPYAE